MLNEQSDEELMLAYQLGDENAFRELYSRHSARVFGYLRSKVKDQTKAQDIFQAAFLKLHKTRSRYNPELPFIPWLFTICRSALLDSLRKERRSKEEMVNEIPEAVPVSSSGESDISLSSLTQTQRQAIELRYGQGASFEAIAKALETSEPNARKLISRALNILRDLYVKK